MGLLGKFVSLFSGSPETVPAPAVSSPQIRVTITAPSLPAVQVSPAVVAEHVQEYSFVLTSDLPPLKGGDQWWEETTHKRRVRDGSDKAYAWLLPFMPMEVAKLEQIQRAQAQGPNGGAGIAKALRAIIRERRKTKQPHEDLLRALYGASVMADLALSLEFAGIQPHAMTHHVDMADLQAVQLDYATLGYQCIESLGKTDAKWLVEAFGEPAEHQSFNSVYPDVRRNAVSRHCWSELRSANDVAKRLGSPQKTMQEWLHERISFNVTLKAQCQQEFVERVEAHKAKADQLTAEFGEALSATNQPFIVADLETTGLNAETDEVLEFAAVLADPSGSVTAEFSTLVRVSHPVPAVITKITGITQVDVDREGRPLADAMAEFLAFIGSRPVFFHNAPFDVGFLLKASIQTRQKFTNPVHDTLPLARATWPNLGTYKLSAIAEYIRAPLPSHRGLADAKTALTVLMSARAKAR